MRKGQVGARAPRPPEGSLASREFPTRARRQLRQARPPLPSAEHRSQVRLTHHFLALSRGPQRQMYLQFRFPPVRKR